MLANGFAWILCFMIIPLLLMGLLGLLLGWLLFRGKKTVGDLSVEGEGALRAEADGLRSRVQELEGRVSTRDSEVTGLKGKLAAAAAAATAAAVTAKVVSAPAPAAAAEEASDDESYALEWRNRYLAARVKYLEGRLADAPKVPKVKAVAKKAPVKKKAPAKKKAVAKKAPKPKVLYTDGPTDGTPDDLKLIKGIGPKFEKDLNGKGVYYFRQIGAWKAADVKMVEGVIDSFPGRIGRDEWIRQANGLAKSSAKPAAKSAAASTGKKKPGPKAGVKRSTLTAEGKPRKKPGPKGGAAKAKPTDAEAKLAKYVENVRKYDASASEDVVKGIVKYCGIALRTRDGSLVACSDETELQRVADGFVTKKLGKTSGQLDLVKEICQDMKAQRFKNRVTFYYLGAKKTRNLGMFK